MQLEVVSRKMSCDEVGPDAGKGFTFPASVFSLTAAIFLTRVKNAVQLCYCVLVCRKMCSIVLLMQCCSLCTLSLSLSMLLICLLCICKYLFIFLLFVFFSFGVTVILCLSSSASS